MDVKAQIRRLIDRLTSSIVRGVISYVSDQAKTQTVQVELRFEDIADAIEHFQPFGLSFNPTIGSECVVLSVGASQDHLIAIAATDRDCRPTGAQSGEGGLYTPSGWKLFLDNADRVHLSTKTATQSFMRGQDVKAALDAYTGAVASAVGKITGQVITATAVSELETASEQLSAAIQQALSTKVLGE